MGPVQILVVGFERSDFRGEILRELRRLREQDIVRLLDVLIVAKDGAGNVRTVGRSEIPELEAEDFGSVAGRLIGVGDDLVPPTTSAVGDDDDAWDALDAIPNGGAAAVALLEHRWAVPLRDAIVRAGGTALADAWIHADDLAAVGLDGPTSAGAERAGP